MERNEPALAVITTRRAQWFLISLPMVYGVAVVYDFMIDVVVDEVQILQVLQKETEHAEEFSRQT
jgi:hypothetical protein